MPSLFVVRTGCAAPVERSLGQTTEHAAAKELTNVQSQDYVHDHFSRKVAGARLLNALRRTPVDAGFAFLEKCRKGVE
jgi:hypothetical protein